MGKTSRGVVRLIVAVMMSASLAFVTPALAADETIKVPKDKKTTEKVPKEKPPKEKPPAEKPPKDQKPIKERPAPKDPSAVPPSPKPRDPPGCGPACQQLKRCAQDPNCFNGR